MKRFIDDLLGEIQFDEAGLEQRQSAIQLLAESRLPTSDLDDERVQLFVLAQDKRIISTGGLEQLGECGLLRSLSVAASEQRKGLGRLMTEEMETMARRRGVRHLYLLTTTAAPFFQAMGYTEVQRGEVPQAIRETQEFSSICPSSAIVMCKDLD